MGCCQAQPAGKQTILKGTNTNTNDFRDVYDVGEKLGEGTFGTVFDCTKKKSDDKVVYAVKMLEHQSSWWGGMKKAAVEQWEALAQEFDMLRIMEHENVIKLHDVFVDRHFLYFVMDKYQNSLISSALPLLQKGRKEMPHCVLGEITAQMLASIGYLHSLKIVHRDVKADNFLVDTAVFKAKDFKVVLTDLGTACQLEDGVFLKELLGTMQYWAPEVVARCYTHKVDVWAIGVVLWCMLTMKFPFNTAQEAYTKTLTFRPDKMTEQQFECIQHLLEKDPQRRLGASDALQNLYIIESRAKHKKMVEGAKVEEDASPDIISPSRRNSTGEHGALLFGEKRNEVGQDVAERRRKLREDAAAGGARVGDTKKSNGAAGNTSGSSGNDDVVAVDKQRKGESKMYSWWSEQRCISKDVPDIKTDCTVRVDLGDAEPAREQAGDEALTEATSVEDLTNTFKTYNVDISTFGQGPAKSLEALFVEMNEQECRMIRRGNEVIRVVDVLALRVRTADKVLVKLESKFAMGKTGKDLPSILRKAGGRGLDRAKAEIRRLLKTELKTSPEVLQVVLRVAQQEQTSYKQDSPEYPGLTTVIRKTLFDATVNMKADAKELQKLGLPAEDPFVVASTGGQSKKYQWLSDDDLKAEDVKVSFPSKTLAEFEGLKPVISTSWNEDKCKDLFKKHSIDDSRFGVGTARSIKQFIEEANSGETRLFSDGKNLTRHLDILVVKIKNPIGAFLIETGHNFGKGQKVQKMAFPATKVRPFEDKVWAVRRLLSEVDIPYSSSKIIFGPTRVEKQESPSYPGITTVYLKQVVEVQLLTIDIANLDGADHGKEKWFNSKDSQDADN